MTEIWTVSAYPSFFISYLFWTIFKPPIFIFFFFSFFFWLELHFFRLPLATALLRLPLLCFFPKFSSHFVLEGKLRFYCEVWNSLRQLSWEQTAHRLRRRHNQAVIRSICTYCNYMCTCLIPFNLSRAYCLFVSRFTHCLTSITF